MEHYYEPVAFNLIHKELHAEGIYLIFVVCDKGFYAFSSLEGRNEFARSVGMPLIPASTPVGLPTDMSVLKDNSTKKKEVTVLDGTAYFYEHTYYRGSYLPLSAPGQISNLNTYGFNDKISSFTMPVFEHSTFLYEHINFGGDSIEFGPSSYRVPDLGWYGWNDRTSSIQIVTWA